jgi:hypothetical protein
MKTPHIMLLGAALLGAGALFFVGGERDESPSTQMSVDSASASAERPSLPPLGSDDGVAEVETRLVDALQVPGEPGERMALRRAAIAQLSELVAAHPDQLEAAIAARNAVVAGPDYAEDARIARAALARTHRFEPTPGDIEISEAFIAAMEEEEVER